MKIKSLSVPLLVCWLTAFVFIPLLIIVIASFLEQGEFSLFQFTFTLENYKELFSPLFLKILIRSITIGFTVTFLCLIVALPFCFLVVKSRIKLLLLLLIIIPFWTSSLIRTYALIALLKSHGLINTILLKLHLISTPLNLLYTNTAVMIGLVYNLLPFMILPLYAAMERFDFKLIDAAKDLGANSAKIIFKVLIPSIMPGIISGCILVLLPAMTLFYIPSILGGARSILLGNLIQQQVYVLENLPQGAASSMILTILLLLLMLFYKQQSRGQP